MSKPTPTPTVSPSPTSSAPAPVTTDQVGTAVPMPAADAPGFGTQTGIAMAGSGAPVVAYVYQDPTDDGDTTADEDQLLTTVYDPTTKTWGAPVKQATGDFEGRFGTDMSIAADPTTGVVAVAYGEVTKGDASGIGLALSTDGGTTWTQSSVSTTAGANRPSVAVGGGKVYVGFPVTDGVVDVATADATASAKFTEVALPGDGDDFPPATEQPALAVSPDGTLLVAYSSATGTDYDRELLTWSPGDATPVKVLDSAKTQNDDATVGLTFQGTTAIAISSVVRQGADTTIGYLSRSTDGGRTWSAAQGVPAATSASGPDSLSLAAGTAETVLAYYPNSGGGNACTGVVLAGSADLRKWQSCDPFAGAFPTVTEQKYPDAVADADGSVYVVFANIAPTDGTVPTGILVWHDGGQAIAGDRQAPPAS